MSFSTPTSQFIPSLDEFDVVKAIGKGVTSTVYLAKDKVSKAPVAIKVAPKVAGHAHLIHKERDLHLVLNTTPFVAPLLASWQDDTNYYMVTPYYAGSDLETILIAEGTFKENHVKFIAAELIVALEGLKAKNILHRDVKLPNIIFTASGHVRLLDLGLATVLEDRAPIHFSIDPVVTRGSFTMPVPPFTSTEKVGTYPYMSPDVLLGRFYGFEADLYSLGVTMFRLLTGRFPFGHNSAETHEDWLLASLTEYLVFQQEDKISQPCKDFIGLLTRRDYRNPVKIEDLFTHEFFEGVCWDSIRSQSARPPRRSYVHPLPKGLPDHPLLRSTPSSVDVDNFMFLGENLVQQRQRHENSVFTKIGKLLSKKPSATPLIPVCPSTSLPELSILDLELSSQVTVPSAPTTPTDDLTRASGDLPPLAVREKLRTRPLAPDKRRPIRGDMVLMPVVKISPPNDENTASEVAGVVEEAPALPLGDITNTNTQRLLSPADAERPAWVSLPSGKTGGKFKLTGPPKKRRWERKENQQPLRQEHPTVIDTHPLMIRKSSSSSPAYRSFLIVTPSKTSKTTKTSSFVAPSSSRASKSLPLAISSSLRVSDSSSAFKFSFLDDTLSLIISNPPLVDPGSRFSKSTTNEQKAITRTPPTAVFMIPPKSIPSEVLPRAPILVQAKPSRPPLKTSIPKFVATPPSNKGKSLLTTPKVKPAFKVPAKLERSQPSTPSTSAANLNETTPPAKTTTPDFKNTQQNVYPRALVRSPVLEHPALPYARSKFKPGTYPRPPNTLQERRKKQPEAPPTASTTATPTPRPKRTKGISKELPLPTITFSSTPQACGALTISSPAISPENIAGFCGLNSPRINLDPEDLKHKMHMIIHNARSNIIEQAIDGPGLYLSHIKLSSPITVGPHYADVLPASSPTSLLHVLRRLWIRVSMACDRAYSRLWSGDLRQT